MQLISEIKNVANDVVPTDHICSLLVYKRQLDLTTSRKFSILSCPTCQISSIKQVPLSELSLLLKNDLQNTETLQLNLIGHYLQDQVKKLGFG